MPTYSQETVTTEQISEKLISLERQRTGNVRNFETLLSEVNQNKLQFNDYQRCLYNYLELYNKALLNGFKQSLPGFNQLFDSCDDLRIKITVKKYRRKKSSIIQKNY